jgi:ABC-2 type transport system ATP-binding protein
MSSPLIETQSLSKRYGRVTALADCSLRVERGEVFGLLGPNGAGKTTLLRLLMGFLRPSEGWARIDGLDCYRQSVAVHRIASYLPGEAKLFPGMKGHDVLEFFVQVRPGGDRARARRLAERLELDLSRRVAFMSTGMKQKLALAAVLSAEAPLLILDEPTSNLDPSMRAEVAALVAEARHAGRTVLFSSHVLSEVEDVCDRAAILREGRLVHTQTLAELRRRHRIRAHLHGPLPSAEALNGRLTIVSQDDAQVVLETFDELAPVLHWLANAPLRDISIEPIGLRAVYDQFHRSGESGRTA